MYGSIAGANTYHSERGATGWAGTDGEKTAALLRGSEWLWGVYHSRYIGDMPDVYNPGEIPLRLEYAAYEAALREIVSPTSLTPDYVAGRQAIKKKVGPLEVQYANPTGADYLNPVLATVEQLMSSLITAPVRSAAMVV